MMVCLRVSNYKKEVELSEFDKIDRTWFRQTLFFTSTCKPYFVKPSKAFLNRLTNETFLLPMFLYRWLVLR